MEIDCTADSHHTDREYPDRTGDDSDGESDSTEYRNQFERDRDRILYSSAFRRLAGVTQVAAVREHRLLHNRLTHSLKVAQLGRRMAQRLIQMKDFECGLDDACLHGLPDIVETAGLAHDIGHPPFGHIAESVLNEEMEKFGGFEGNAQSLRVVAKLAVRNDSYGLNLTRASLNAILKYPRFREEVPPKGKATGIPWHDRSRGTKWGAYDRDQNVLRFARESEVGEIRSPAAIIMDWADDVSYVTHDIYDYFTAGLMPLQSLKQDKKVFLAIAEKKIRRYESFDFEAFKEAYKLLRGDMPSAKFRQGRGDRIELNQLMSRLIARFADALHPTAGGKQPYVEVQPDIQYQVEVIKQLTWFYVIDQPALAIVQEGQKQIIRELFTALQRLLEASEEDEGSLDGPVPVLLRDIFQGISDYEQKYFGAMTPVDERRARAICDYICLLTEDQAVDLYERITGHGISRASIFGAWFD